MKQAKDAIVFPLDVPSVEAAKKYIELLSGEVGIFKVGLELFVHAGPDIVRFIRGAGDTRIFLDLKLYDIPATVSRAMKRVADLGVAWATVHCGESPKMLAAAVEGGAGKVGILGVTVLTSVSSEEIHAAGFHKELAEDPRKLVLKRAAMAHEAGCAGVVCSGREAAVIKSAFGKDFLAVTPGIRPAWEESSSDDQTRVTTPAQAIRNGADYLVIGRPIRDAADPREAARRIAEEIAAV